jgi:hypothetical protein
MARFSVSDVSGGFDCSSVRNRIAITAQSSSQLYHGLRCPLLGSACQPWVVVIPCRHQRPDDPSVFVSLCHARDIEWPAKKRACPIEWSGTINQLPWSLTQFSNASSGDWHQAET